MSSDPSPDRRLAAAVVGLLAAGVAVGVAELVAGLAQVTSVIVSLGEAIIELAPQTLTEFVIGTLGGLDRGLLLTSVVVTVALLSVAIGLLARRDLRVGAGVVLALGLLAAAASAANPADPAPRSLLPGLAAIPAGVVALRVGMRRARMHGAGTHRVATPRDGVRPAGSPRPAATGEGSSPGTAVAAASSSTSVGAASSRREFLKVAGALSVVAAATVAGGRWLQVRASAVRERLELALPAAARPAPSIPAGADFDLDGLAPHLTPNADFFRIDTAASVPNVLAEDWQLRIHGLVDREVTLTYADLLERELVEEDVTLVCVSNEVGGQLIGNARWLGVRLDELLREVGIQDGATQIVGRSVDGFTAGFPVADALDGRDALLAIGMNGEPLPLEHGYPVRIVVPGLYGYVSAVKWLAELEVTTFEAYDPYWIRRNWAREGPVKTQSRIDRPGDGHGVDAGEVVVAGVAWAQTRGIERVEVQVDDGDWLEAELAELDGELDTWRQWRVTWDAEPGRHELRVRATDGTGETQGEDRVDPVPDGAEGWHTIEVQVA